MFDAAGAKLMLADIGHKGLDETLAAIMANVHDAETVTVDVGSGESVRAMVDKTLERFGRLDGAFNNAAVEQAGKS